ncbi:DNA replication/repair protein RecF [Microbacterium sediminicola]|uniref:DNA replication and repair protein RecF n=1 Tax=Microbacterium sediminicola TaxID=415210 RepID=A0ABP4UGI2_9MICO
MIVERLSLTDFRNYGTADLDLFPGPNVFVGRNGQGKTNLIEAIGFLATLGSHRVSQDAPMVRDGAQAAIIRSRLAHGERRITLEVQVNRQGSNRARVNGTNVRTSELTRYAHVVLFAPEDLQIVRGDPSSRRRFADQLLIQRAPRMSATLADYDRVLKQRSALLKSARQRGVRGAGLSTLDVWDDKLVALGTEIIRARAALIDALHQPLAQAYSAIAGADHSPAASWQLSVDAAEDDGEGDRERDWSADSIAARFREALRVRRGEELDRAVNLVGPHRDDLLLTVRSLPVRGYASHGESWSVALALRLASARLLRAESMVGDPIVILDDVFAELDAGRRARLASVVADFEQVLVTAAVGADVPSELRAREVYVEAGTLVRVAEGSEDD